MVLRASSRCRAACFVIWSLLFFNDCMNFCILWSWTQFRHEWIINVLGNVSCVSRSSMKQKQVHTNKYTKAFTSVSWVSKFGQVWTLNQGMHSGMGCPHHSALVNIPYLGRLYVLQSPWNAPVESASHITHHCKAPQKITSILFRTSVQKI
jgi:hypothetical protein